LVENNNCAAAPLSVAEPIEVSVPAAAAPSSSRSPWRSPDRLLRRLRSFHRQEMRRDLRMRLALTRPSRNASPWPGPPLAPRHRRDSTLSPMHRRGGTLPPMHRREGTWTRGKLSNTRTSRHYPLILGGRLTLRAFLWNKLNSSLTRPGHSTRHLVVALYSPGSWNTRSTPTEP